ncbi:hypothetical protein [Endozoicomonas sp. GU-1]|uniref:hypothetical protein n=1 Tax=Endozoicomonas sp. GU-1 TaxID=3009078 RepID=UPI0022B443A3|nr:hypothetical protein [Endozoicomonas sp. GU-1]WBA79743.1 hypothetical protein O2T12_15375 [Endozoicomonas sp. GU-1]WBA87328.1 hypothetical protein O3276_04645 [Endozoicomonas sp. GU-1]
MHQTTSDNQTTRAEVYVDGNFSLAERKRERRREHKRKRYQTDPAYAEREKEFQRRLRKDPTYAKRKRERERVRQRVRYQTDPAYAERERVRKREHQRELRKDPAYAERKRERQRKRQRELRKDPAYVEGQKIYTNTYKRIKIQTSNKKEAKEQAVIARERYLQSVNSTKNPSDLPLTFNLAETTQEF